MNNAQKLLIEKICRQERLRVQDFQHANIRIMKPRQLEEHVLKHLPATSRYFKTSPLTVGSIVKRIQKGHLFFTVDNLKQVLSNSSDSATGRMTSAIGQTIEREFDDRWETLVGGGGSSPHNTNSRGGGSSPRYKYRTHKEPDGTLVRVPIAYEMQPESFTVEQTLPGRGVTAVKQFKIGNEMRLIKIIITDNDKNLPLDSAVVYHGSEVAVRDVNSPVEELCARGILKLDKILNKHNTARTEIKNVKESNTMGHDVMLLPIEYRDLDVQVVTV